MCAVQDTANAKKNAWLGSIENFNTVHWYHLNVRNLQTEYHVVSTWLYQKN